MKYVNTYKDFINEDKEVLFEIGDSSAKSYDYKLSKNQKYLIIYEFTTQSGENYSVLFNRGVGSEPTDISFTTKEVFNAVINRGEVFSVMSTVVKIIKDYVKRFPAEVDYSFSAAKNHGDDKRRENLYMQYLQKELPNADITKGPTSYFESTYFIHLKQ